MFEAAFIAIALCIDSLALGLTYGMRKIKIKVSAIIIINFINACLLGIAVMSGRMLRQMLSVFASSFISSIILIGLGSFFILEGYIKHLIQKKRQNGDNNKLIKLRIPKLGIIIDIALDVTKADMDISGDINLREAIYIGFILSLDSLGAGFGYAVGSIRVFYFLLFVFVINILSLSYGLKIGNRITNQKTSLKTSLLPGMILIMIGILKWL